MTRNEPNRLIGVHFTLDSTYERAILEGIVQYAANRPEWMFSVTAWEEGPFSHDAGAARPSGLIARQHRFDPEPAWPEGVPVVHVGFCPRSGAAQVTIDSVAIGRLAAEHLIDCGLQHFAFRGDPSYENSVWQHQGFTERLAQDGFECIEMAGKNDLIQNWSFQDELADTHEWLDKLPRPVGVYAFTSGVARRVVEACRRAGVRVPEDVAVVAGDNDEMICMTSRPELSGVELGGQRVGYRAAEVLDGLMSGNPFTESRDLIEPVGVVARRSSDMLAVEDEHLSTALEFVRRRACDGICVEDVLMEVPISRRSLEKKFLAALGRSPSKEIRRVQMERAKQLLAHTDWSMAKIAEVAGFANAMRFSANFRHHVGLSPTEYRGSTRVQA